MICNLQSTYEKYKLLRHHICFSRLSSQPFSDLPIRLQFHVSADYSYEGDDYHHYDSDHHDGPDGETRRAAGEALSKLRQVEAQQEVALTRGAVQRKMAESISDSLIWWTVVESIGIVTLGALNVRWMKSQFEVKQWV